MSSPDTSAATPRRSFGGWGIVIILALVVLAGWFVSVRNDMAGKEQDVFAQFGQVQNVMQRRTDVLVNVANAAAAAAANERGALTDITNARREVSAMNEIVKKLNPADLAASQELQEKLFQAMAAQQAAMLQIKAVVEAYPTIRATDAFLRLQDEVSGSENRVAVERMRAQQKILAYNRRIVMFPANVIAAVFGYKQMAYFTASEGAQQAPDLGEVLRRK